MADSRSGRITISLEHDEQVVVLAIGDGEVILLTDKLVPPFGALTEVQCRVWGARLRAMADVIDPPTDPTS